MPDDKILDPNDVPEGLDPDKFFVKVSLKKRIFKIMDKYPNIANEALYFEFPDIPKSTITSHKREWRLLQSAGEFNITLIRSCIDTLLNFLRYKTKYSVAQVSKAEKEALDTLEKFVRGEKV